MELSNIRSPNVRTITPDQYVDMYIEMSQSERIVKNNLNRYINKIGDISFRILLVMVSSYIIYVQFLTGQIESSVLEEIMKDRMDTPMTRADLEKLHNALERGASKKEMEELNTWYKSIRTFLYGLSEINIDGYNSTTSAIRRAIKQSAISLLFILDKTETFIPIVDAISCVTDSANCKNPVESMAVILLGYGMYPWFSQLLAHSIATTIGFIAMNAAYYSIATPFVITKAVAKKAFDSFIIPPLQLPAIDYGGGIVLIPAIKDGSRPLCASLNQIGANVVAMMTEEDVSLTLTGYILGQPLYYGPPALARGLFSLVKKAPAAMSFLVTSLGGGASVVSMLAAIYVDTVLAHGTPILTVISMVSSAHTIMTQEDDGDDVVGGGDSSNGSNGASVLSVSSSRVVHDGNNETLIMDYSVCNKTPTNSRLSISSLSDSSCETETRMLQINVEELRLAILALLKSKLKHSGSRSKSRSKLRRVKTNRSNRSNRSKRHKKRVAKSNGYTKNKKRTNYRTV